MFTIAAIDNVDHNPSSTTSEGSFHGTSISLVQIESPDNPGEERTFQVTYKDVEKPGYRSVPLLPENYVFVPDYVLPNKNKEATQST